MGTASGVLRRIARPPQVAAPLTPARALRLATVRAAERSLGLSLSVLSVGEEEAPLDEHLAQLDPGLLLLQLRDDGGAMGLVGLDLESRRAAIEMQTLGGLLSAPAEPREVTAADVALAAPFVAAFVEEARAAIQGTALDGWIDGAWSGSRLAAPRDAALVLADGRYRQVRLTLDFGMGERQGLLILLARVAPPVAATTAPPAALAPQVLAARVPLDAVLGRLRLTLRDAEALAPGQVIPLPGVTVASVRLQTGGREVGTARLGQMSGSRAVRIEEPLAPSLQDLRPRSDDPAGGGLPLLPDGEGFGFGSRA